MTIMLMPDNRMVFLGTADLSTEDRKRLMDGVHYLMGGGSRYLGLADVEMIIDARVEPAIAFTVPK